MSVFSNYAKYYDLFYRDKDYAAEGAFALSLIEKNGLSAQCLLELGCGTGAHAEHLAAAGLCIHGVDRSPSMLELAMKRQRGLRAELASRLAFSQGDVREVRLAKSFDAAISLFHVLSYQVKNEDVVSTFATARAHLKPRGFFVFDCWYGPAVLTDRPAVRVKRLEDEDVSVTRVAEPIIRANDNVVDVHYTILVCDKRTRETEEFKETHSMRYFFLPELEMMAAQAGLRIVGANGWMQKDPPSTSTWNACFVAQA